MHSKGDAAAASTRGEQTVVSAKAVEEESAQAEPTHRQAEQVHEDAITWSPNPISAVESAVTPADIALQSAIVPAPLREPSSEVGHLQIEPATVASAVSVAESLTAEASLARGQKRTSEARPPPRTVRRNLWQAQVPYLYDLVVSHRRKPEATALAWPAGAARVWPGAVLQRLVVGTADALLVMAARLPWENEIKGESSFPAPKLPGGSRSRDKVVQPSVRITQSMPHEGTVNRLACSPHSYLLTATQTDGRTGALLFRIADWEAGAAASCRPEQRLGVDPGASRGLAWRFSCEAHLLSSLPCGGVGLWDVDVGTKLTDFKNQESSQTTDIVCGTVWPELFASCDVDGFCQVWDVRAGTGPVQRWAAHPGGAALCAAWPEENSGTLASGGEDGLVQLRELRQLSAPLASLKPPATGGKVGKSESVSHLAWSPFNAHVLACAHNSGRVLLWDTARARVATAEDSSEPPGLVFVHGGHSSQAASGLAWSQDCPWLLASCSLGSEDISHANKLHATEWSCGELQFWSPASRVLAS